MLLDFLWNQVQNSPGAGRFSGDAARALTTPVSKATAELDAKAADAARKAAAAKKNEAAKTKANKNETQSLPEVVVTADRNKKESYVFPADQSNYSMQLNFGAYKRERSMEQSKMDHDRSITLPLPAALGESFGIKYRQAAFGPLINEIIGATDETLNDTASGKEFGKSLSANISKRINKAAENSKEVLQAGFSRLAGGISEDAGAAVDMITGVTPNPGLAVAFQHIGLRAFTYSWRLAPRSLKEAQTMIDIIRALKLSALPIKQVYTLTYPDLVDITLHPADLNEIIKYKRSVITDVKVNWAPNGVPSFFARSQIPTECELTLSFQETGIFTAEDFEARHVLKGAAI